MSQNNNKVDEIIINILTTESNEISDEDCDKIIQYLEEKKKKRLANIPAINQKKLTIQEKLNNHIIDLENDQKKYMIE